MEVKTFSTHERPGRPICIYDDRVAIMLSTEEAFDLVETLTGTLKNMYANKTASNTVDISVKQPLVTSSPMKKYAIHGWDYHGHHSIEQFETADPEEALRRFKIESMQSYGPCTLYECPNGFKTSCQTSEQAGYVEIKASN